MVISVLGLDYLKEKYYNNGNAFDFDVLSSDFGNTSNTTLQRDKTDLQKAFESKDINATLF